MNPGKNFKAPATGTDDFEYLSNTIDKGLRNAKNKIQGFKKLDITEFKQLSIRFFSIWFQFTNFSKILHSGTVTLKGSSLMMLFIFDLICNFLCIPTPGRYILRTQKFMFLCEFIFKISKRLWFYYFRFNWNLGVISR